MPIEGVDYSSGRPGGAALAAAGKKFAIRYIPYQVTKTRTDGTTYKVWVSKGLTAAEIPDLRDHGIAIALVFESTAGRALTAGYAGGAADAKTSAAGIARFASLGMPPDLPIYFAVDRDTTSANYPAIDDYFRGVISVLGLARVGVYGEYNLCFHLRNNNLARWFWQTLAWSGGQLASFAHLYQYNNGETINGSLVDFDRAYQTQFGQWWPPLPDSSTGAVMDKFFVYEQRAFCTVKKGAQLWPAWNGSFTGTQTIIDPGREMVYVGTVNDAVRIVAYEPPTGDPNASSQAMYVAKADLATDTAGNVVVRFEDTASLTQQVTDLTAKVAALTKQVTDLTGQIATLKGTVTDLSGQLAVAEQEKQAAVDKAIADTKATARVVVAFD